MGGFSFWIEIRMRICIFQADCQSMLYPFVTVGLFVAGAAYVIYLLAAGRFRAKLRTEIFPGLFFFVIWILLYFLFLR